MYYIIITSHFLGFNLFILSICKLQLEKRCENNKLIYEDIFLSLL